MALGRNLFLSLLVRQSKPNWCFINPLNLKLNRPNIPTGSYSTKSSRGDRYSGSNKDGNDSTHGNSTFGRLKVVLSISGICLCVAGGRYLWEVIGMFRPKSMNERVGKNSTFYRSTEVCSDSRNKSLLCMANRLDVLMGSKKPLRVRILN